MNAWKRHVKSNPPAEEVSLGDRAVACDCDPRLHRPVQLPPRDVGVHACLRCCTVTAATCRGDDGRSTGNPSWAWFTHPVAPEVLDWLGAWPRVRIAQHDARWPMAEELVRRDLLYYPPNSRCQDVADLANLEATLSQRQRQQTVAERLRTQPRPLTPPPPGVPSPLNGFMHIWEALHLLPDSDLPRLIYLAQLRNGASPIAADLLRQRPDAFSILEQALRSADPVWQSAGYAMARDAQSLDGRLAGVILEVLLNLPLAPLPDVPGRVISWAQFEALLNLIADLNLGSPEVIKVLGELQRRLLRKDLHLVEYIRVVLRELTPESVPSR